MAYPAQWTDSMANGYPLAGVPNLIDDQGNSNLPDGVKTSFKLSKKNNGVKLVLKSTDNGATWSALSLTTHYTINTTLNTIDYVTAPAVNDLLMIFYTTKPEALEPSVNTEVVGEIGRVVVTNSRLNNFAESLIKKVPTGSEINEYTLTSGAAVTPLGKLDAGVFDGRTPKHDTVSLIVQGSPAVKAFAYQSEDNVHFAFKEMKYAVTWGDDNKFVITDNVTTTIDDNGNTILAGQKEVKLPSDLRGDK